MNPIIADTHAALVKQTKLDEKFHADLLKAIAAVYQAGVNDNKTVIESEPLTHEEIAAFRDFARGAK